MNYNITLLPQGITLSVPRGSKLLSVLADAGVRHHAPCGGSGKCGKCRVLVNGREVLACGITVDRDMTVTLPREDRVRVLDRGAEQETALDPLAPGFLAAFDIGTTTVVCFLLDGTTGAELGRASMPNPQAIYGADVISRIRAATDGALEVQSRLIRGAMSELLRQVCGEAEVSPTAVGVVSVVGNPAMQQLFLGIPTDNLAAVPFSPVLTRAEVLPCGNILPCCPAARVLVVPDISGYVGADTLGCVLATGLHEGAEMTLLVDIGTNGEMVLGNRDRMIACSTAAGPALEGANIRCGMRAAAGAIDHVWLEDSQVRFSVIGGGAARGICGSGLIDATAVFLDLGMLNRRGRIQSTGLRDGERFLALTEDVFLTQEDIRQLQLAKGAIQAGIRLMTKALGLKLGDIDRVLLAGAFGTYLDPASACRIGLLPPELAGRITAVGNAAGGGAKMLARNQALLPLCQELRDRIEFLELAKLEDFPKTFARAMGFEPQDKEGAE